jgi:IMP dehydrogenase
MSFNQSSRVVQKALTFDDVLLIPAESSIKPRETELATKLTREISLNMPIVSAAMDTVTEASLAVAMAELGGIGIVHKNMSIAAQAAEIMRVKKFESGVVKNPVTVSPNTTIGEIMAKRDETNYAAFPVLENDCLVGIITSRDVRFETNMARQVHELMTPKARLVTAKVGDDREAIISLLSEHRVEKVLVVDENFHLSGMVTVKDILKAKENPFSSKDAEGCLRVGAAVDVGEDSRHRVAALVEAGVDVLVVDTAHGHSIHVLEQVKWIKQQYPHMQVIGGNVATAEAANALVKAGVDAVKVGIGPGSICTTRIVTGVGVPQFTAIMNISHALRKTGVPVIADGGIRFSGDLCKAIGAGAWSVMVGSLFAGTEEAPGEVELYQGRSYKSYRGMGSLGAMAKKHGSSGRYFQEDLQKLVPEGIEARVPFKGAMGDVVDQLAGGLRSSMGYTGCKDLQTMREKVKFVEITHAGMRESHVHGVRITKEAPNYQQGD